VKIVHVCVAGSQPMLSPYGGAVQRRILELSKVQARMGHDVTAFSVGESSHDTWVDGVRVRFIRCVLPMPWRHGEYLVRILAALLREPRPDVLNFHGQPEGLLVAKILRRPAVLFYDYYRFRGGRRAMWGGLYKRILRSFDLLLPCSQYCMDASVAHWGLDERNVAVQHNGVDPAQFNPDPKAGAAERKELGIDGRIVLYVGRVNSQKGTDLLLESFALLRRRVKDVSLIVAGPISQFGPQRDPRAAASWAQQINDAGGIYLGPVEEAGLAGIYNTADVFVMPTRTLEMFGMAAVEAQACGIPVVASDHGGLRETVPEDCGGRFPSGDAPALAAMMERLIEDEELRERCSEAALVNAGRFTWDEVTADLEKHYAAAGIHG
jgi:glycosyltransferase involved in cell wall biosynthesis